MLAASAHPAAAKTLQTRIVSFFPVLCMVPLCVVGIHRRDAEADKPGWDAAQPAN